MRFPYNCQTKDQNGRIISGAICNIFLTGTATPASVYTAATGGVAVNSVASDGEGKLLFYVDRADYPSNPTNQRFDITVTKTTTQNVVFGPITMIGISIFPNDSTGYEFDALEYGAGTYTQATIASALTAIGSTPAKLLLRANPAGGWAISTPLAIPSNITLNMPPGSYFTYSGTGVVTGIKNPRPTMFGINTTPGTTDMATAINRSVQSAADGYVDMDDPQYGIGTPLVMKSKVVLQGHSIAINLPGPTELVSDYYATTIKLLSGSDCDMVTFAADVVQSGLVGIGLDGNKAGQSVNTLYGVKMADGSSDMNNHRIQDVGIHYVNGYGLYGGLGTRECYLNNVRILYCRREGAWLHNSIDWTGEHFRSGWNGNSALRLDGVGGTDSGTHRFSDVDFFGPNPTYSGGMTALTDVFAANEAGSCVVMKGVIAANRFVGGAIQAASRHGLMMVHADNTSSGLRPSLNTFIDVLFNVNSAETTGTYDQCVLYSGLVGDPVFGNRFLLCKFYGGEGTQQPAHAINDINVSPANAGNMAIGCTFDSTVYATNTFSDNVRQYWQLSNDLNMSSEVIQIAPDRFRYRSITDTTGAVSLALFTHDTVVDVYLAAGARTMTLPAYTTIPAGHPLIIVKSDTTGAVLTIAPATGESIGNGAANAPIYIADNSAPVMLINEVGTWKVIRGTPSGKVTLGILANSATPSVKGANTWRTGGTTTITDFTDGYIGQEIQLLSEFGTTITNGTNIFLNSHVNFVMAAKDSLRLMMNNDGHWYETGRMVY
jgi:hypothetical protein